MFRQLVIPRITAVFLSFHNLKFLVSPINDKNLMNILEHLLSVKEQNIPNGFLQREGGVILRGYSCQRLVIIDLCVCVQAIVNIPQHFCPLHLIRLKFQILRVS
jgi:hypothetical protein